MNPKSGPVLSRRRVFAGAGTVGALAAAAAVLPRALPAADSQAADARGSDADGRYQLTAHVRRYYQTTKV
jgi:hypothetical protein